MSSPRRTAGRHPRRPTRGQSLVEFALVLPITLFLTMIALDFGRLYLGYINVQNMVRIAANYAADHPTAWTSSSIANLAIQARYKDQIIADAKATNCDLPLVLGVTQVPPPTFTDRGGNGTSNDIGDTASVALTCQFSLITPIISNVFGGKNLNVSASSAFPVKSGMSGTAGSVGSRPSANFTAFPTSGPSPLNVQFTDSSTGSPTAWAWDFDSDGVVDSTAQNPTHVFSGVGVFSVTLVASNSSGSSTLTRTNYISTSFAPATVDFTATPTSGVRPLSVQFTDTSTGSPTAWAWDFDNNGTTDSTVQNPVYVYTVAGTYTVKLTATNAGGPASKTIANMITVSVGTCTVPNFANTSSSAAQGTWNGAGFTTTVNFAQGGLPWTIRSQTQVVGQSIPCNSTITVSKN